MDSCPGVYHRISTHFIERIEETFLLNPGPQRGIDLRTDRDEFRLPADKRTLLFFRLGDGTTVIKMEDAGCPPFWKQEFKTIENVLEYVKHSVAFVKTRVNSKDDFMKRKEHVPQEAKEVFYKALVSLYPGPSDPASSTPGDTAREEIREVLFQQGIQYGISYMIGVMESLLKDSFSSHHHVFNCKQCETLVRDATNQLKQFTKLDQLRLYKGERKGKEVCLPNPNTWHELFVKWSG
eukprot:TRINITY_DN13055_c0_g1_i2.p1 TRINITY_DN13055_c0_g1~~TRINITY_DN13055_c0_g1_i2.p1  ORF type:complete len:273 (-),score=64.83 TRINITY_DN13055_c0_g1_i2:241-951(-)